MTDLKKGESVKFDISFLKKEEKQTSIDAPRKNTKAI